MTDLLDIVRKIRAAQDELHRTTGQHFGITLDVDNRNVAIALVSDLYKADFNPNADEFPLAPDVTLKVTKKPTDPYRAIPSLHESHVEIALPLPMWLGECKTVVMPGGAHLKYVAAKSVRGSDALSWVLIDNSVR